MHFLDFEGLNDSFSLVVSTESVLGLYFVEQEWYNGVWLKLERVSLVFAILICTKFKTL